MTEAEEERLRIADAQIAKWLSTSIVGTLIAAFALAAIF